MSHQQYNHKEYEKNIKVCTPNGCIHGNGSTDLANKLLEEANPILEHVKKHPNLENNIGFCTGGIPYSNYLREIGKGIMKAYNTKDTKSLMEREDVPKPVKNYVGFCYKRNYI